MNSIWQDITQSALGMGVGVRPIELLAQAQRAPAPPRGNGLTEEFAGFLAGLGLADLARFIPNLIGAIAILLLGWIVALVASAIVRGILDRTNIDNRIAAWITGRPVTGAEAPNVEKWIGDAVYWIVILFTLVAFLQALNLTAVSEPLNRLLTQVFEFLPRLAGAAVWLGVAWGVATIVKLALTRGLRTFGLDERLNHQIGTTADRRPFLLSETLANALYWFIFLLFLTPILETLGQRQALEPVQNLLDQILAALPKILKAVIIGAVGWLLAQVVRQIVTNLLMATGLDRLGARFGLGRTTGRSLSWIVGTIVYVLILIPTAVSALTALDIEAISVPAIAMLNQILDAVPKIFTAGLILAIAYILGRFVADLVSNILSGLGFDRVFDWLGLPSPTATEPAPRIVIPSAGAPVPEPSFTPPVDEQATLIQTTLTPAARTASEIVGIVVLVGIMLFATVAALNVLQLGTLTILVTRIVARLGFILAGLVIFGIGLYLANLAFKVVTSSGGEQARILGHAARIAIITLSAAMALQQMGIAPDIINLAFGLLLGAIAVAIALAFGLGSRDVAAEQVREWLASFKEKRNKPPHF